MAHKQTKLEEIAIEARKSLVTKNTFNDYDNSNNYSATHTNAKSDEITPKNGKGTGVSFDTANGGSSDDINGVANAVGSGRIANVLKNEYNDGNDYHSPDMTGNIGQVTI
jgi:hypothetical protein